MVALLLPIFLLTGCGDNAGSGSAIDGPGKKILYAPLEAKLTGLDPMLVTDVYSALVSGQCYEGLYQYHYLKNPEVLIPALADGMPAVSADRLTYTIKIRKDVTFVGDKCFPGGKGRNIRAEDFIFHLKRIANVKNVSPQWSGYDDKIVGLDEFREYTKTVKSKKDVDYNRPIEGLKALDEHTLQIKLKKPWPQLRYSLAGFTPIAREAVDHYGDQFNNVAVGTGPFIIKTFSPGSKVEMVRNPTFRKEYYPTDGRPGDKEKGLLDAAGKPIPFIDGIVYYVIEEDQPYWLSLMKGTIDVGRVPKDFLAQTITTDRKLTPAMEAKGLQLVVAEEPSLFWLGFNMEDAVVGKNPVLRLTMSMAFNRQEFIHLFRNDLAIPAKGIFPPCMPDYDKTFKNPWTQYDPNRARELMKEAEKINGGKVTVTVSVPGTDTLFRQMGEYFKRSMAKIDVNVKLDYSDWPTYLDKMNKKLIQISFSGMVFGNPDGIGPLMMFYGPYEAPGPNSFNFKNKAFDELYRKVEVMDDSPERRALYRKMERMVCEDCPAIFHSHALRTYPYYRYLKNFKYNPFNMSTTADAKYFDIDLKLRKELVGR